MGCVARIKEKLKELTPVNQTTNALIVAELERNGIKLVKHSSKRNLHEKAAMAGHKAGNSARFDKPVGQGGVLRLK